MIDVESLSENFDLECKAAQGRDGRGELPGDFWGSYSAMANGEGGVILLGVQEKPQGCFKILGLADPARIRKALWDNLNNRKQISANLLAESDIEIVEAEGKALIRVRVPRAPRQSRPVHVGANPFGGTYVRRFEGDYLAEDDSVRRMLAERVEDSRDERILRGFGLDDLDLDTVAAYRNRFAAVKPGHVWADLPLLDFLERIGAMGRNREEDYKGLRVAGLLMFGRAEVIRDELPNYMVDYRERLDARAERRWMDRLVPDGSWSGNIYDFFRRVYQKLTADLKVPFQLREGQRIEDTPVHEALREALVNTLIHADFSGRVSVLVVKMPDLFGFRNPGRMRIPLELAVQGGNSDCRNRRLQTMFQLVGYGDHAGSGLPKIYQNWQGQHWRSPQLYELSEPEQTRIELRMSSLVPADAVEALSRQFGERFAELHDVARLALITAQVEDLVSHNRLKQVTTEHPADLTKLLGTLVRDGFLVSEGSGRGMVYHLPGRRTGAGAAFDTPASRPEQHQTPERAVIPPELDRLPPEQAAIPPELGRLPPEQAAIPPEQAAIPPELGRLSPEQAAIPPELGRLPPEQAAIPPELGRLPPEQAAIPPELGRLPPEQAAIPPELGRLPPEQAAIPPELDRLPPEQAAIPPELGDPSARPPIYPSWDALPAELQRKLSLLADPVARQRRTRPEVLHATLRVLCAGRFLGLRVLTQLLNRNPDDLRKRTLTPLVEAGRLRQAYPNPKDPRQAYMSAPDP